MAGREKKPALVKKQMLSSPIPPKEAELTAADVSAATTKANPIKGDAEPVVPASASASPAKPIRKTKPKKPIKKNLKINFKAKAKTNKKLKLTKSIFKASKLDKTLIKNGIKAKRKTNIRKPAANVQKTEDLLPPVLEPQVPIPEPNSPAKKEVKKRVKKVAIPEDASGSEVSEKKLKPSDKSDKSHEETVEDILNEVANELDIDLDYLMKKSRKAVKKPKAETSAVKTEDVKPKRGTPKKLKPETSKFKKSLKKENLIEPFCNEITLDSEAQNVINSLDLNVTKTTRKKAVKKRRHSIEKIPAVDEVQNDSTFEPPFVLFPNTRRSASPRSKRNTKIRKSVETPANKRLNPYTTRSDSPARILRNGKHRRLRESQLLEGLDSEYKKRRRLCSEYSGSEISKYSGYLSESDSSFSDLASLQENGANDLDENVTKSDILKKEILESINKNPEVNDLQSLNIKQISNKFTAILKRSLSTDTTPLPDTLLPEDIKPKLEEIGVNNFIDTNSNDLKVQVKTETDPPGTDEDAVKTETKVKCERPQIKIETTDEDDGKIAEKIASSPSEKLPEKSLILDSMKLTFNDVEEVEKRATRSSKRIIKFEEDKEKLATVTTTKFYGPDQNEELENEETEELDDATVEEEPSPEVSLEAESFIEKELIEEEIMTNEEETIEPIKQTEEEEEETRIEKDTNMEFESIDKEMDDLLNESSEIEPEMNEADKKKSLEEELLSKLQENSSISIVRKETPKAKEESPMLVGLNGDVYLENKENTVENVNSVHESPDTTEPMQVIEESPEDQAIKENILSALGLQSLRAAEEAKQRDKQKIQNKPETYTGTLKTVIKLNRQSDKKKRNPLKMTLQKSKSRNLKDADGNKSDGANSKSDGEGSCYKVMKETGSSSGWKHGSHSSDTAGANRKSHYFNRSNMDISSEHASDGDIPSQDGESSGTKALVIPEKASSFSIHPDRLCSDECAYCFGKFGLFDTPLHIAQIKSEERQKKILQNEIYLTRDSCLCDACYRHVDRRVNTNSNASNLGNNKNLKRNVLSNLPRQNNCHVLGCDRDSSHVLRRKWLMKMRKSVLKVINIDLDNPGLHSIPICSEHYAAVEHLMVCALCKRRLARNHIHYLGFELETLNNALDKEGIPVKLTDKPVVCKLCRYFATLLVKDSNDIKSNTANFFKQYKKRLLHFHDIEVMDEAEAEEPISVPLKEKVEKEITTTTTSMKKSKSSKSKSSRNSKGNTSSPEMLSNSEQMQLQMQLQFQLQQHPDIDKTDQSRVPSNSENGESRESSPPSDSVDIETLVPNMILECASDTEDNSKSEVPHHHHHHQQHQLNQHQQNKALFKKLQIPESVREAVEISKIMKMNNSNNSNNRQKKNNVVERLGSNPSISVRQLFPGEEDLPLQGNIDFNTVKERTPEGWEKCSCTIQYDVDTKHLWQELQKPYGNQSSFLRHLILLEKYFRNGDLTLSPNASHHAVNYSVSVQNRLRAYDNIPTNSLPMQPLTMLPFNQVKKSQSGIITTNNIVNAANLPKNTPIPISSLNPNFLTQLSVRHKSPGVPPGLISLQPGTNRPVAPLVKMPQRFKLPVGTKWRPTLIPVNPKGAPVNPGGGDKRITGLVQVISGGKPYHISLADYNRMCCLKKSHEMKQQKGAEVKLKQREPEVSASSVLKPVIPRKPKVATVTSSAISVASAAGIVSKAVTVTAISKDSSPMTTVTSEMKNGAGDKIHSPQQQQQLNEIKGTSTSSNKSIMILPKIPKSLTVIPQTVPRKPLQPTSPTLSITTKPSTSKS